ncbi:MAG: ABC transporter permease [Prevotella sp.]|jgi:ABC-2 type transport system permease protein|nr:ABC transporter permease [Prevotella sp.]
MKQFISFIRKEIYHITRDPLTLVIMLVLPVIMLLILGFAVSTEITNTEFVVLDESKSTVSEKLIGKIEANEYFNLSGYLNSADEIEKSFQRGESKMAIIIPSSFGNEIGRTGTDIQIMVDASNPNEASTIVNYFQSIMMQYQMEQAKAGTNVPVINSEVKMLYNPQMKSAYNIVPGMIGMLMMLICALMTSISVVREKEQGTMEILLVSPLKPATIMFAKAVPYLVVAFLDVIMVLVLAYFVLDVPIVGSIPLILLLSVIYTFSALALGLLISTITNTQQTAMIASGVGLMLPSMLLSGLIFPVSSMPDILQWISYIIPARWFIDALRSVMIKGLGFEAIWIQFLVLLCMTIFFMNLSIKKFKNRL